jgi:PhzF family phenazine biosynthesis protein
MTTLRFRILNVFTVGDDRLSGNPLCVFEDARGLSDLTMQALARQFNLSETTFILSPSTEKDGTEATARVRIFTPNFEMPFAGHPTLGTAHVVRDLRAPGDRVVLEMKAGLVEVRASGDDWTFRTAHPQATRTVEASRTELSAMLGIDESAIRPTPLWVDTGAEQLVIPLASANDVARARPDAGRLAKHGFSQKCGAAMAYAWARETEDTIVARFFFLSQGSVVEDPATGSACANLGGFLLETSQRLPVTVKVRQGEAVGRPSRLNLHVDETRNIFVGGRVIELGRGTLDV